MKKFFALVFVLLFSFSPVVFSQLQQPSSNEIRETKRTQRCLSDAASYHHVNVDVLAAIVRVESKGNPRTVSKNKNNSIDVGLVGINSIHFPDLKNKGVFPQDLLDECVSLYVGAWMYSKKIHKHGNTWRAIGAYNSETPGCNYRYQTLIHNELVSMKVIKNSAYLSVPSGC